MMKPTCDPQPYPQSEKYSFTLKKNKNKKSAGQPFRKNAGCCHWFVFAIVRSKI